MRTRLLVAMSSWHMYLPMRRAPKWREEERAHEELDVGGGDAELNSTDLT